MRRGRIQRMLDVYNVLNANDVGAETTRFGPNWVRPSNVKGARVVKFWAQLDF
jgi:hypothetical protein